MIDFTNDEQNLMCIYGMGISRTRLIDKLLEMKDYLEEDEKELLALTESEVGKLSRMTDTEFESMELVPDFDV